MSKRNRFLSKNNIDAMVKRVYQAHIDLGNTYPLSKYVDVIPGQMRTWPKLKLIDSYESLIYDEEEEMMQINSDFYTSVAPLTSVKFNKRNKLETVDDYLNFDIQREPATRLTYRNDNPTPVNRRQVQRHYEQELTGDSHDGMIKEMPGMEDLP